MCEIVRRIIHLSVDYQSNHQPLLRLCADAIQKWTTWGWSQVECAHKTRTEGTRETRIQASQFTLLASYELRSRHDRHSTTNDNRRSKLSYKTISTQGLVPQRASRWFYLIVTYLPPEWVFFTASCGRGTVFSLLTEEWLETNLV